MFYEYLVSYMSHMHIKPVYLQFKQNLTAQLNILKQCPGRENSLAGRAIYLFDQEALGGHFGENSWEIVPTRVLSPTFAVLIPTIESL
jgi:hypothetical protein